MKLIETNGKIKVKKYTFEKKTVDKDFKDRMEECKKELIATRQVRNEVSNKIYIGNKTIQQLAKRVKVLNEHKVIVLEDDDYVLIKSEHNAKESKIQSYDNLDCNVVFIDRSIEVQQKFIKFTNGKLSSVTTISKDGTINEEIFINGVKHHVDVLKPVEDGLEMYENYGRMCMHKYVVIQNDKDIGFDIVLSEFKYANQFEPRPKVSSVEYSLKFNNITFKIPNKYNFNFETQFEFIIGTERKMLFKLDYKHSIEIYFDKDNNLLNAILIKNK